MWNSVVAAHGSANTIETDCDCKHYKDSELCPGPSSSSEKEPVCWWLGVLSLLSLQG